MISAALEEERDACFDRRARPRFEGKERGVHGELGVLGTGLLVKADELIGMGRIQRTDLALGPQALAADDEVVLAAKFSRNLVERGMHLASDFGGFEVVEGFIDELPLREAGSNLSGEGGGNHNKTSLVPQTAT